MANQPGCSGEKPNETHDMKTDTESNAAAANKASDAATTSADAAAAPGPTPAEKKAAKAKDKAINAAEKKATAAAKKVADELKAEKDKAKAAEKKAAAVAKKAAADKEKADKKALATVERGVTPLIQAGLKAMNMVGNGNQAWTIAAFKMRELCKGTPVNFKDVALEHWGVQKNTATKLANAGELLAGLIAADKLDVSGTVEKDKWLSHLPMGSINNLSVISGFTDAKIDKGIDLEIIKIDATEADISAFARDYNDKGVLTVVETVPAGKAQGIGDTPSGVETETISDSETPIQFISRVTKDAKAIELSPAHRIKLAVALTAGFEGKDIDALFDAMEKVYPGIT